MIITTRYITKLLLLCLLLSSYFSFGWLKIGALQLITLFELVALVFLFIKPAFTIPFYILFILLLFNHFLNLWEKVGLFVNGNAPFFEMGTCLLIAVLLAFLYPRFTKEKPIPEIITLAILVSLSLLLILIRND